jgi:predicted lipid-binding transport protein (Tim44 family)
MPGDGPPFSITLTPSHLLYGLAALLLIATYLRTRRLLKADKPARTAPAERDKGKNEERLKLRTLELFREIQQAWAEGNTMMLERRLEGRLLSGWSARRAEPPPAEARLSAAEVGVVGVSILNAKEHRDDSRDEFTARIEFAVVEAAEEKGAGGKNGSRGRRRGAFTEYWTFARRDGEWRVRAVMRDGVMAPISLALEPALQEDDARHP